MRKNDDYDRWLHDSIDDVIAVQHRVFPDTLIEMHRTNDFWVRRKTVDDREEK